MPNSLTLLSTLPRLISEHDTETESKSYDLGEHIKHYIDEHYLEDIDLKSIADELRISHYYLAHRMNTPTTHSTA